MFSLVSHQREVGQKSGAIRKNFHNLNRVHQWIGICLINRLIKFAETKNPEVVFNPGMVFVL